MPDPDRQVELTTAPHEPAAGAVVSVLEDAGIEAWLCPSDYVGGAVGIFASLSFTPTTVIVRARDLAGARGALDEARIESVTIDWSEVETGDDSPEDGEPGASVRRRPMFIRVARKLGPAFVVFSLAWAGVWLAVGLATIVWQAATPPAAWGPGPEGAPVARYRVTVVEEVHPLELLLDATFGDPDRLTREELDRLESQFEVLGSGGGDAPAR